MAQEARYGAQLVQGGAGCEAVVSRQLVYPDVSCAGGPAAAWAAAGMRPPRAGGGQPRRAARFPGAPSA